MYCDNWSGNVLCVVDNLVHTGNTLSDVHAGDTCEMESFQRHLSCRLTDTLGSNGTNRFSRLHDALVHFLYVDLKEVIKLKISNPIKTVLQVLIILGIGNLDPLIILS